MKLDYISHIKLQPGVKLIEKRGSMSQEKEGRAIPFVLQNMKKKEFEDFVKS